MTIDCSLNSEISTWKLQAQNMLRTCWEHVENILCTQIVFCFCPSEKDLPVVQCWWGLLCSAELPTESKCDWNGSWLFPKLPRLALPPFVRDCKLLKPEPEPEPVLFRPVECQASGQSESIVDTCSVCGINVTTRLALAFLDRLFSTRVILLFEFENLSC